MEEKAKTSESQEQQEKGSNCCVKDLSIDEAGEDIENIEGNLNKSFDEIQNFKKKLTLKENVENVFDEIFLDEEETEKSQRSKTICLPKKGKMIKHNKNK